MPHRARASFVLLTATAAFAAGCTAPDDEPSSESSAIVVGDGRIARGSTWSYWDRGGDLGTAWRARTFDDAAWPRGAGPLGYGESYLATTVSYGSSSSNKHVTTYFRTQFTVADPAAVRAITGELLYDDGIVVYLNGNEIGRQGVPSPSTAATLAAGHEASPSSYERYDWSAQIPHLVAGVNTIAVEVHQQTVSSSDLVFDLALTVESAAPPPPPTTGGIPRGSTWRYYDQGGDLSHFWTTGFYEDGWWPAGRGPLGYGESYLRTVVGYGGDAANKHITTYFRAKFTVDDPAAVRRMTAELMYDDGLVVHINGRQVLRRGLPTDFGSTTLAAGHEANNAYETADITAARSFLQPGENTIAVEVHQQSASSSDLAFDLGLTIEVGPPPPPSTGAIARGSTWSYWDRGGDLGTSWRGRTFADGSWARGAGPLGYGETYHATTVSYGTSSTSKHVTTYFRRHFDVADPASVTSMIGELMYDDGLVVYLNGNEVQRRSMPSGTITASTLAFGFETGNLYERHDWSAARGFLVPGDNVIAVEVHQSSRSSSDLTFDLSLTLTGGGSSSCAVPPQGDWTGVSGYEFEHSGGGWEETADVTWTLASTSGCVDRYTPSGTAYSVIGAHYCVGHSPTSHPIDPGDGELIIDRTTNPPTYRMNGSSTWDGVDVCDGSPQRIGSDWARDHRGTVSGNVISGGVDDSTEISWDFRRVGSSFPPPSGCVGTPADRWTSTSSVFSPFSGGVRATVTWQRVSTTGCQDHFTPLSGTADFMEITDGTPHGECRSIIATPDTAAIGPDDGDLYINRGSNPPTFQIRGGQRWAGTTICTHNDGTTEDRGEPGGMWAEGAGAFDSTTFAGGTTDGIAYDWRLTRQ